MAESDLSTIMDVAASVSFKRRCEMSEQSLWLYQRYFSTIENVALTTLDIINDRVFPHHARVYEDWNFPQNKVNLYLCFSGNEV